MGMQGGMPPQMAQQMAGKGGQPPGQGQQAVNSLLNIQPQQPQGKGGQPPQGPMPRGQQAMGGMMGGMMGAGRPGAGMLPGHMQPGQNTMQRRGVPPTGYGNAASLNGNYNGMVDVNALYGQQNDMVNKYNMYGPQRGGGLIQNGMNPSQLRNLSRPGMSLGQGNLDIVGATSENGRGGGGMFSSLNPMNSPGMKLFGKLF